MCVCAYVCVCVCVCLCVCLCVCACACVCGGVIVTQQCRSGVLSPVVQVICLCMCMCACVDDACHAAAWYCDPMVQVVFLESLLAVGFTRYNDYMYV